MSLRLTLVLTIQYVTELSAIALVIQSVSKVRLCLFVTSAVMLQLPRDVCQHVHRHCVQDTKGVVIWLQTDGQSARVRNGKKGKEE